MRKVKKGDQVIVKTGKSKGLKGTVLRYIGDCKVLVEGVNMVKKHVKENPQLGTKGGVVEQEAPMHVSNVALVNQATGKADRVGFKVLEDGRKVRYFKSNNEVVDA